MDYKGMAGIFKGLAASGSWGCFDEFNRLIPEVLSVCTVQFKSVTDGVKAESARIVIESDEISLDPTCGAFITMNPGYLGELFQSAAGIVMVLFGCMLLGVGAIWTRKIIRVEY